MLLIPASQVGNLRQRDNAAPSLHPHYKGLITTTSSSAPRSGIGILPHGVCHLSFPLASETRFSRSIPKPVLSSWRLYTDCRRVRKQVSSRLILRQHVSLSFGSAITLLRCVIGRFAFAHLLNTYLTPLTAPFPQSLTTTPFERSSTGRFETSSCKPISGGLLPSSVQHRKLPFTFVTHTCRKDRTCRSTHKMTSMPSPCRSIPARERGSIPTRRSSFILGTSRCYNIRPTLLINPVLRLVLETALPCPVRIMPSSSPSTRNVIWLIRNIDSIGGSIWQPWCRGSPLLSCRQGPVRKERF